MRRVPQLLYYNTHVGLRVRWRTVEEKVNQMCLLVSNIVVRSNCVFLFKNELLCILQLKRLFQSFIVRGKYKCLYASVCCLVHYVQSWLSINVITYDFVQNRCAVCFLVLLFEYANCSLFFFQVVCVPEGLHSVIWSTAHRKSQCIAYTSIEYFHPSIRDHVICKVSHQSRSWTYWPEVLPRLMS